MSIVRWGVEGSHVYIYHDVGGGITCCGCDDGNNLSFEQMREHIREHVDSGDVVPKYVVEYFEEGGASNALN